MDVPASAVAGESLDVAYILENLDGPNRVEYFWDSDPGWGKATPLMRPTGFVRSVDPSQPLTVSTSGLEAGNHQLVIRAQSAAGYWVTAVNTVTITEPVVIVPTPVFTMLTVPTSAQNDEFRISFSVMAEGGLIDWVEYYWDNDPGLRQATCIVDQGQDGGSGVGRTDYLIECSGLMGSHTLYIRAFSGAEMTEHRFQNVQLTAHPIDAGDLEALKLISDHLGLNGYWNFDGEGTLENNFPGVRFVDYRVTEIDLSNHALTGELSQEWMPSLPELMQLDLSRNNITGDVTPLVARMPNLRTLDLSHNRITQVSGALPSFISSLNLESQMRVFGYNTSGSNEGFVDAMKQTDATPATATVGARVPLELPSLFYYNGAYNDNSLREDVEVVDLDAPATVYGTYHYNGQGEGWQFTPRLSETISLQDGQRVALVTTGGWQRWSAVPARLGVALGDANIDGSVNILDVQHTLNYILATAQPFNLWAANTYDDKTINVQDIVCTINIILGQPNKARRATQARSQADGEADDEADAQAWLYEQNERIAVYTATDVAAVDVELDGVSTDEVSLLLNHRQFQMVGQNTATGSRYIIFSPTGAAIPAGTTTALLAMSRHGSPVGASCADTAARKVGVAVGETTAVSTVTTAADGTTVVETRLAPGIYIVRTTTATGESKTVKILKKEER